MPLSKEVRDNTLVDTPRLNFLLQFLRDATYLNGDMAEVGVYKGGTAYLMRKYSNGRLFLFDTFEGMPDVSQHDLHKKGDFNDTTVEHVDKLLSVNNNYAIYKGVFPRENSEYISHRKFSLVHLDVDIYDSVKECLEFFIPRMIEGGVIVLDDYNEPNCPGAKLAADEVAQAHGLTVISTVQSQAFIQF